MGKDYSDIAFEDDGRLKLLIIVGTRPEVIRLSEVIKKCRRHFDCLLAHTGQNYDYTLNGIFFRDLELADPDVYLDAVGADLGETVGNIIAASYKLMVQVKPDALLILGDTNSCLSAIAAKRLHIPIFHMEAGNRCKDECLPEETNRRRLRRDPLHEVDDPTVRRADVHRQRHRLRPGAHLRHGISHGRGPAREPGQDRGE